MRHFSFRDFMPLDSYPKIIELKSEVDSKKWLESMASFNYVKALLYQLPIVVLRYC